MREKIQICLILAIGLIYSKNVTADAGWFTKKKCWFDQRKYNASATVTEKKTNQTLSGSDRACTYEANNVQQMFRPRFAIIGGVLTLISSREAYAKGWSGPNGNGTRAIASRGFTAGGRTKYKFYSAQNKNTIDSTSQATSEDSVSDVQYNSVTRKIIMKNFYSKFGIESYDLNNHYVHIQIKAFESIGDEGDGYTGSNIFKTISIYLQGNTLTTSNISSTLFTSASTATSITYNYVGGDLEIDVPSGIDFENVGLYFNSDVGDTEIGSEIPLQTLKLNNNPTIAIRNIFPNPLKDVLSINLYTAKNEQIDFCVYDINGKVVFKNELIETKAGDNILYFDLSNLNPNNYFIIVKTNDVEHKWKIQKE
ncbi:MAG: T9SS type A sorting domain-containing protein [bacterium]|nr:T9SS type A sorting domain-containing protein [bacterium]